MVRLINKLTGGDMWVADNRVEEYKAAGHVLAAEPKVEKPVINPPEASKVIRKEVQTSKSVKKTTAKRRKG